MILWNIGSFVVFCIKLVNNGSIYIYYVLREEYNIDVIYIID